MKKYREGSPEHLEQKAHSRGFQTGLIIGLTMVLALEVIGLSIINILLILLGVWRINLKSGI